MASKQTNKSDGIHCQTLPKEIYDLIKKKCLLDTIKPLIFIDKLPKDIQNEIFKALEKSDKINTDNDSKENYNNLCIVSVPYSVNAKNKNHENESFKLYYTKYSNIK